MLLLGASAVPVGGTWEVCFSLLSAACACDRELMKTAENYRKLTVAQGTTLGRAARPDLSSRKSHLVSPLDYCS